MGKDKFKRQILHILTNEDYIKQEIERTYRTLSSELKQNTLIISTVCKNCDWIFTNATISVS